MLGYWIFSKHLNLYKNLGLRVQIFGLIWGFKDKFIYTGAFLNFPFNLALMLVEQISFESW